MQPLRITQTIALGAVQAAADAERVDPAVLSAAAYRRFRLDDVVHALPSDVAIALLFGGWHHACELAHDLVAPDRRGCAEPGVRAGYRPPTPSTSSMIAPPT